MPLTAKFAGQRVISVALSDEEWAQLKADVRAKRRALVLACGYPGHGKTSPLGTRYFAHNPGGDGCSAGESKEHLLSKEHIVRGILAADWEPSPEHRSPDGEWIADVLAERDGVRVVFEVQWSPQSADEYTMRTDRYRASGIQSIAWFARKPVGLSMSSKTLPVFRLTIDGGVPTAHIETDSPNDSTPLPLADVVERLLTRRIQHRTKVANGHATNRLMRVAPLDCYKCHQQFGIWEVLADVTTGNCGLTVSEPLDQEMFQTHRLEATTEAREAGHHACQSMGIQPARLGSRSTRASGTRYMAFICPHCNATSGDFFNRDALMQSDNPFIEFPVAPKAIHHQHWCVATPQGLCAS